MESDLLDLLSTGDNEPPPSPLSATLSPPTPPSSNSLSTLSQFPDLLEFLSTSHSLLEPSSNPSKNSLLRPYYDVLNKLSIAEYSTTSISSSSSSSSSNSAHSALTPPPPPSSPSELLDQISNVYSNLKSRGEGFGLGTQAGALDPSILNAFFPPKGKGKGKGNNDDTDTNTDTLTTVTITIETELLGLTVENILERTVIRSVVPGGGADKPVHNNNR